jgi:hypothetical protein
MTQIKYNNIDPFSGICYTPFVTFDKESDGWWNSTNSFTLEGQIICCGLSVEQVIEKRNNLIKNFSENFKTFEIIDNGSAIHNSKFAYINSIEFDDSDYNYILPFSVSISIHDYNAFSGSYFVQNPENRFEIYENQDGTISINHGVSAEGIQNDNTAIQNACDWVYGLTGLKNFPGLAFISSGQAACDIPYPSLVSISESIDRINGKCEVSEQYILDPILSGYENAGILRYTVNVEEKQDDFSRSQIRGEIKGGLNDNINAIRSRYKDLDLWSICAEAYLKSTSKNDLNNEPVEFSIDENTDEKTISFEMSFSNDNSPLVYIESTSEFNKDLDPESTEGNSATLNSTIYCKRGLQKERYQNVLDFFKNNFSPENEYLKNVTDISEEINLQNMIRDSESYKEDEQNATISYNCSWREVPKIDNENLPCFVKNLSINIKKTNPIQQYNFSRPLCADWAAVGTFISKYKINLDIEITYVIGTAIEDVKSYAEALSNKYMLPIILRKSNDHDSFNNKISFNYEWEEE